MNIVSLDSHIIEFLKKAFLPFARMALFTVYVWFGMLKVLGLSPASELVHHLFDATLAFMPFHIFYVGFAWFEVLIGVLFIIPKATRFVIPLLLIHMITTFLPFVFLPSEILSSFMVPTMEGQYIIKNLIIIALAIGVAAHVDPIVARPPGKA
jgi:uncharacterized membrane protein YphA (DoxX/SURF4 family)